MGLLKRNETKPEQVNFEKMTYPETSNYFLLAPLDVVPLLSNPSSPVFDCSIDELEAAWHKLIKGKSGVSLRSSSKQKHRYHYCCKTWLFRFADYLVVQFFPVGERQSTVLMYSYSVLGSSDFGCNQRRIFSLLIALKKAL